MDSLSKSVSSALAAFHASTSDRQIECFISYIDELVRWNRSINLTGLESKEAIVGDLILDALFLHTILPRGKEILDLGSGSGILAVPLSILDPESHVISLDKSLKKIQFQRHVKRLLDLQRLEPVHARAEDLPPLGCDVVVAKAFGSVHLILTLGGRHLCQGGQVFMVRGSGEKAPAEEEYVLENSDFYSHTKCGKTYRLFVYKKVP
jgi:16S rRNA (guanine527-N7)-methyltransferase